MTEGNSVGYMNNPKANQLSEGVNNSLGVYLTTEAEAESQNHLYPKGDDIYANDARSMNSPGQESSIGIYLMTEGADEIEVPLLVNNDLYPNDSPEVDPYSFAVCPTNITAKETQTNGFYAKDTSNSNLQQQQDSNDMGIYLTNIPDDKTQSNGLSESGHIYTNDLTNSRVSRGSNNEPGIYMDMDQESNDVREQPGKANDEDQKINAGNPYMDMGHLMHTNPSPAVTDTLGVLAEGHIDRPGVYMDMDSSNKVGDKQEKSIDGSIEDKKTTVGNPYMDMGNLTNTKPSLTVTDAVGILHQGHIDGLGVYMDMDSKDSNDKVDEKQAKLINGPMDGEKTNVGNPYMDMGNLTITKPSSTVTDDLGIYLTNPDDDPEEKRSHEMYVDGPPNEAKNGFVLDPEREVYIDIIDPEEYDAMVHEKKSQINAVAESPPKDESAGACCENGYLLPVEARAGRNNRTNDGEIRYVPDPTTHNGSPQPPPTEVYHTIDLETVDTSLTSDEELTQPKVVFQTTPLLTQSETTATENSPDGQQDLYVCLDEMAIEPAVTLAVVESKEKSGIKCWHIMCLLIVLCAVSVGIAVWAVHEGQTPKPTQALLLNGTEKATAITPTNIQLPPADHTCDPTAFTGVGKFNQTETILSGKMALFICPTGFVAVDNFPQPYIHPICKNGVWEPFPQCAQITTTTRRPTTVVQNCQLQNTDSVKFERVRSNRPVTVGSSATRKIWFNCGEGYELVGSNSYTYCTNGVLIPAPNCTETAYSYDYSYK